MSKIGFYSGQLPPDVLSEVQGHCERLRDESPTPWNQNLAGFIEEEYKLNDECKKLILPHIYEGAGQLIQDISLNLSCPQMWVNYQKKYEVNPIHFHSGFLSFVLWIKIPFKFEEERNRKACKNSTISKCAASFCFVYYKRTERGGNVEQQPINLSTGDEGKFVVFPSTLMHMVYPFYTSDEERISISGNLVFR